MNKLIAVLTLLLSMACSGAHAADRATKEEALEMLKKAKAFIKANGKDKALAEFNNTKGAFVDRDLYVVALDMSGKVLAHGANQRLVGKDLIEIKDPDGKPFVKEQVELAKTKGSGSVDFKFVNPLSKDIEKRTFYLESQGDYFIGAGVFVK
jgi:cytochrome c